MTVTAAPPRAAKRLTPVGRLVFLGALAVLAVSAYLLINSHGNWSFALAYRGRTLAALVIVGWAIAVSTVLFHTITANRILTPSILGFDALYAALQTVLVFTLGTAGLTKWPPIPQFLVTTGLMMSLATVLFGWLFGRLGRSLHLMILIGIVIGTLLRSVTGLLQRVMEPNSYLVLQGKLFASFSGVQPELLAITAALVAVVTVVVWVRRDRLDVLALGRDLALSLGVNHRRETVIALLLVSLLVSASTALVGPILFFGLLVANLAYAVAGTHRHAFVLPAAGLLAVITLVGGQAILQHLLGMGTVLSVIIEFVGGLVFIIMLLDRRKVRSAA